MKSWVSLRIITHSLLLSKSLSSIISFLSPVKNLFFFFLENIKLFDHVYDCSFESSKLLFIDDSFIGLVISYGRNIVLLHCIVVLHRTWDLSVGCWLSFGMKF